MKKTQKNLASNQAHSPCLKEACEICKLSRVHDTSRQSIEIIKNKLTELIHKNPDKAATILKGWINR